MEDCGTFRKWSLTRRSESLGAGFVVQPHSAISLLPDGDAV